MAMRREIVGDGGTQQDLTTDAQWQQGFHVCTTETGVLQLPGRHATFHGLYVL